MLGQFIIKNFSSDIHIVIGACITLLIWIVRDAFQDSKKKKEIEKQKLENLILLVEKTTDNCGSMPFKVGSEYFKNPFIPEINSISIYFPKLKNDIANFIVIYYKYRSSIFSMYVYEKENRKLPIDFSTKYSEEYGKILQAKSDLINKIHSIST